MSNNVYTENGVIKDFGDKGVMIIINADNLKPIKIEHKCYTVTPPHVNVDGTTTHASLNEVVDVFYPHPDPVCASYGANYHRLEIHPVYQAKNEVEDQAIMIGTNTEAALAVIAEKYRTALGEGHV